MRLPIRFAYATGERSAQWGVDKAVLAFACRTPHILKPHSHKLSIDPLEDLH
jgi:hypothetical protein